MGEHTVRKGLDLPIAGVPDQSAVHDGPPISRIAVVAADYPGMKPTMLVNPGDSVKRGQALFEDKKSPGTFYTAPGAGTVHSVNRGERRALVSVVIELSQSERSGNPSDSEVATFESYSGRDVAGLSADEVRELLIESGLWTTLRSRPFSRVPRIDEEPGAIFITAMDTNPLAPDIAKVYAGREDDFDSGVQALAKFRPERVFLCKGPGSPVSTRTPGVKEEIFKGPHPSGTPGYHIHTLYPVNRERLAWYVSLQDVIAIGRLFRTGKVDVERVVSVAGPAVEMPKLVRTRVGASTEELVAGNVAPGDNRIISGSVLNGRTAMGEEAGYLGRYHQQVSVLAEGRERQFMGWLTPGVNKFSVINTFVSKLDRKKRFKFTTSTNGSARAMVPIGVYERVMPMDILPTFLLRSLVVGDIETAEKLGVLELDEEDLALCTFVCPGKYEYGPYLRAMLTQIELEG